MEKWENLGYIIKFEPMMNKWSYSCLFETVLHSYSHANSIRLFLSDLLRFKFTVHAQMNIIPCSRATFNALEDQLVNIDRELHNKNHALNTDLRCLDLRHRLTSGDRAPPSTQTDRNIQLTRLQDELPPEP